MKHEIRTNTVVIIGFLVIVLSLSVTCSSGFYNSPNIPVPEFHYPGKTFHNNLKLVTVLTDPYGNSFYQGRLNSNNSNGNHNFGQPFATSSTTSELLFLLDHARGIVYKLEFDTSNALVNTSIYPRGRRRFPSLIDLAIDPNGILWIIDSRLKSVFMIDESGKIIDSISAIFKRPIGITYHKRSNQMLITDLAGNSISAFDLDGELVSRYDEESGYLLESPSFITCDNSGRVYVVEALTALVKIFSPNWTLEQSLGGLGDSPGFFAKPKGIAVDKNNRIYVADALFDNIQIFDSTGALLLTLGTTGDEAGSFWQPTGLHIDQGQRLFVADSYNKRVQVFRWEIGE